MIEAKSSNTFPLDSGIAKASYHLPHLDLLLKNGKTRHLIGVIAFNLEGLEKVFNEEGNIRGGILDIEKALEIRCWQCQRIIIFSMQEIETQITQEWGVIVKAPHVEEEVSGEIKRSYFFHPECLKAARDSRRSQMCAT